MIVNPQVIGQQLPDLTSPAGAGQILSGYQAINADGEIVTGTIPSQGAQTITPGTSAKTIAAGRYLSGTQTISGDSDLVPANIKSGVNIFGVSGSYSGKEPVYGEWSKSMVSLGSHDDFTITMPSNVDTVLGLSFGQGGYGSEILGYYILGMDMGFAMSMEMPFPMALVINSSRNKISVEVSGSYTMVEPLVMAGGVYCYIPA